MYLCNFKIPLLPCAPYPCINLSFTLVSACGVANMSYSKATLFISNLSMNLCWFYAIPILMKEALSNMEKHTYPLSDMCFWFIMSMQLRHYFHIPLRTPISCAGMYGKLLKLCTKKCFILWSTKWQWISGFQAATGIHMPYLFKGLVFCFLNMQSFSYI